jgi:hypothetical protein
VSSITISAATLAMPMPNADPQLFHIVKRFCEEEIERQKAVDHPLNGIREAMMLVRHQPRSFRRNSPNPNDAA